MRNLRIPVGVIRCGLGLVLAASVMAPATEVAAGVHELLTVTDNSANATVPVTDHLMVTITSSRAQGGNPASVTLVSVGGTVAPTDVAAINVYYGGILEGSVSTPATLTNVSITLPNGQKGGSDWTYTLSLNASAGGKTFNMTVTSITGTDNAVLPFTTATRNALAGNTSPTVTITAPADASNFDEGVSINFTGTASDTEDGDLTANLAWTSSIDGAIGTGGSFPLSNLSVGTHTITASVTDSGALTGQDQISITINNVAPTVAITNPADASNFDEGVSVNFTGTASDPNDGDISGSLSWTSSIDGSIGSGGSFSTSTLSVGTHTITASVIDPDDGGVTGQDQISVTINNVAPTVTITEPAADPNATEGDPITFTATATDPNDGDISAGLSWTSDLDGPIGTGATFVKSDLSVGVHTITAQVTDPDDGGVSGQDQVTVTVNPPGNTAPTVTITAPPDASNFDEAVSVDFSATASDAEDGDLTANLAWTSSIDGSIGTGGSFSRSDLSIGLHTITASVTDSGALTGEDQITITINNVTPTVTITQPAADPNATQGDSITFAATATDPGDGDISANLSWSSNLDGVIGTGATFATTTLSVGVHTITASVADPDGGTPGQDQVTVTVNAPPANEVTVNPPTATVDNCNQITVTVTFSGDDNNDSSALFQSSPTGGNPWTNLPGCSAVAGASPRTCVHTVADNSVYFYRTNFTDGDGVIGTDPSDPAGPYDTSPYCSVDGTTITANSAEATTCKLITTTSVFVGDDNHDGYTEVQYNTSNSFPGTIACAQNGGASPRQCLIPEMAENQDYWLRFHFVDPDGVAAGGAPNDQVIGPVNTGTCSGDGVAPTLLAIAPSRNAVIGGIDRVKIQVFDSPIGSVTVVWSVDGGGTAPATINANYDCGSDCAVFEFDLNTTTLGSNPQSLSNGSHSLSIEATDGDGHTTKLGLAVTVNNSDDKAAGSGYLLRRTHGSQLCTDCHNLPTHSSQSTSSKYGNWAMDCRACHTAHLTTNIYLIDGTIDTPNSGTRPVRFENKNGAVADSTTPGAASYVNEDNSTEADGVCQACHTRTENASGDARWRNSDSGGNADTHYTSASTSQCTGCHTHDAGFSGAGGGCDSCHFAPPTVGKHGSHDEVGDVPSDYANTTGAATAGLYSFACAKCHSGSHFSDPSIPHTVDVAFDATVAPANPGGTYAADAGSQATDPGSSGEGWYWSNGTCANLYCHSNASPLGGTPSYASPTWDQAAVLDCTSCHDTAGAATTLSNAHRLHTDPAKYGFECLRCHVNTITAPTNDAIADKREHVDGEKDVFFDSGGVDNSGGAYTGSVSAPNYTCSNTYCHSDGIVQSAPYSSGPSIAWNATSTCLSCHNGDANAASTMASGTHGNHVNNAAVIGTNYECADCHSSTVTAGDNETITGFGSHVDGTSTVSGILTDGTYVSPNCNNAYCHSSGQDSGASFENYNADWSTGLPALDCKGCHGRHSTAIVASSFGEPDYPNQGAGLANANSHDRHVTAAGDCTSCHNSTTSTGTAILASAPHTDQTRDVVISPSWDTNGGTSNYDSGTKTCNSVKCHGSGTPQWGASLTCLACHSGAEGGALGDGTPNGVNDEWTQNTAGGGHGGSRGGSLASTLGGCDYCHQLDAAHTPTTGTNPYRLRFGQTDNTLCLQCHETGDSGISQNSAGTGLTLEDSSLDVDAAHFGAKHEGTEGGKLCWDCHDPHGVPSNILMVKSMVSKNASAYGVPGTTVTVNFTDNSTPGQAVGRFTESTNTPRTGICQACHDPAGQGSSGPTNYWRSNGTIETHNPTLLCTDCHFHPADFKGAGGDCLGCHGASGGAGTTGPNSRRPVAADFGKNSHHVGASVDADGNPLNAQPTMGGALTNFDCVVCHAEGRVNAGAVEANDTLHQNGLIDLRDTDVADGGTNYFFSYDKDSIGGNADTWMSGNSSWETENIKVDRFCLSCHDLDGASANFNSGTNEGLGFSGSATNPFADTAITNEYDQQSRGSVVNIRNKVDAYVNASNATITPIDREGGSEPRTADGRPDPTQGIYSRHAIRGDGTFGSGSVYGSDDGNSSTWVGSWNDTSLMGCGDCHTTDGANTTNGNAHGSNTEYLLKNSDGLAGAEATWSDGDMPTSTIICYKCHAGSWYQYLRRTQEHTDNSSDWVFTADQTGSTNRLGSNGDIYGLPCTNCHGGAPAATGTGFGSIHGTSDKFQIGAGPTQREAYRFMNGASLRYYDPNGWNTATVSCYTLGSGDSFGGCTQHSSAKVFTRLVVRPIQY